MSILGSVDKLNFAVCRLAVFHDAMPLSVATGFFHRVVVNDQPATCLVTNWHVLAGRNSDNPALVLHRTGALPNRLSARLVLNDQFASYLSLPPDVVHMQEFSISLYRNDGKAGWHQHPTLKNKIDVALIIMPDMSSKFISVNIDEIATANDMAISIGLDLFVLGYPLGFSHFIDTPIWKRASIASEPHLEGSDAHRRVIVDATTRSGMSGSPVVARAYTHYLTESGEVKCSPHASRFIGIYASRPDIQGADERESSAEIGYVYKSGCIGEILQGLTLGPDVDTYPQ